MNAAINAIKRLVNSWIAKEFGYCLWVPEYSGFHYAMNSAEFKDWIMQYPEDAQMYVFYRGKCI